MVTPVSAPKTITAQRLCLKRMFPADDATKFDRARDDRRRSGAVLNPNALERIRSREADPIARTGRGTGTYDAPRSHSDPAIA